MRPVDKGNNSRDFNPYSDAQQPLVTRLGEYCSYCERWIASGIHVEHKKPKNDYPEDQYRWSNFLLACGNCNSGKGHGKLNLDDYLWPDCDNTFRAFAYDSEGRVLPRTDYNEALTEKIKQTWIMLGLNKHPDIFTEGNQTPTIKDNRWLHRREAWQKADRRKQELAVNDTPQRRAEIVEMACERGFFSIWLTVFADDQDMKTRLIRTFTGTSSDCFDAQGVPLARPGGKL
ncbi:MAG: HNH endonuclease [Methylobacter sp.]